MEPYVYYMLYDYLLFPGHAHKRPYTEEEEESGERNEKET